MKKNNNFDKNFGSYIREIRIKQDIGQRELAKKIGIAASYLNDIEKGKRTAPKFNIIKKISAIIIIIFITIFLIDNFSSFIRSKIK